MSWKTLGSDIYLFLSHRNKSYTTWSQVPWYIVQGNASIWMQESSFERWHFIASELIVISLFIEIKNVLWVSLLGFLSSFFKTQDMPNDTWICILYSLDMISYTCMLSSPFNSLFYTLSLSSSLSHAVSLSLPRYLMLSLSLSSSLLINTHFLLSVLYLKPSLNM